MLRQTQHQLLQLLTIKTRAQSRFGVRLAAGVQPRVATKFGPQRARGGMRDANAHKHAHQSCPVAPLVRLVQSTGRAQRTAQLLAPRQQCFQSGLGYGRIAPRLVHGSVQGYSAITGCRLYTTMPRTAGNYLNHDLLEYLFTFLPRTVLEEQDPDVIAACF